MALYAYKWVAISLGAKKTHNNNIQKMDEQHFKGLISLKKLDVSNNPFIFKMDICQFSRKINPNELDLVIFNYNSFI